MLSGKIVKISATLYEVIVINCQKQQMFKKKVL